MLLSRPLTSLLFAALLFANMPDLCQAAKIKNVLLLISDDLKASALGCYGNDVCKTPNLDALASRSMVFERAYCQGTWCAPSRKSFMYSKYHGDDGQNLGEYLRAHGMYSARVGKIFHMRVPGDIIDGTDGADVASTWDERFNSQGQEAHSPGLYSCLNLNVVTRNLENRQSTRMPHRMFVSVETDGDGSDQPDSKSADKAIELLRQHGDKPFFLAVGMVRPHYPMVAPPEYFQMYPFEEVSLPHIPTGDTDDIPKLGLGPTLSTKNPIGKYPDNQKRMWSAYYASVSFMDQQIGRIIEHLDASGLAETTAVVFTSDHGYHLGEHTMWQKSNLHEEVTRIPLMISVPGAGTGRTNSLAELVDIYPTLVNALGQDIPTGLDGKSLLPVLSDGSQQVREYAISFHNGASLRGEKWAYMRYTDGTEELYDMQADPKQYVNLAKLPEHLETLQSLRTRLQSHQGYQGK